MACVDLTYISNEECIGNSLSSINGNFAALSSAVCDLSGGPSPSELLTLINTLSTNMQNIGNYPYLEYAWVTSPNTAGQSITSNLITTLTIDTEVADTRNFGSLSANQITLSAGTYQFRGFVPARWTGGVYCSAIIDLYDVTNNKKVTSGPAYTDYSQNHSVLNFDGQYTITSPASFILRIVSTTNNTYIDNGASTTVFSLVSAGVDQRTTLKLWKVG